jgi:hypothetical protein
MHSLNEAAMLNGANGGFAKGVSGGGFQAVACRWAQTGQRA